MGYENTVSSRSGYTVPVQDDGDLLGQFREKGSANVAAFTLLAFSNECVITLEVDMNREKLLYGTLILPLLLAVAPTFALAAQSKPNIVFIMGDDIGM